jgi:hypothetical protein
MTETIEFLGQVQDQVLLEGLVEMVFSTSDEIAYLSSEVLFYLNHLQPNIQMMFQPLFIERLRLHETESLMVLRSHNKLIRQFSEYGAQNYFSQNVDSDLHQVLMTAALQKLRVNDERVVLSALDCLKFSLPYTQELMNI